MENLDRSTVPSTISLSIEEPQFEHDCDECIFLGRWEGVAHPGEPVENFDLYACKRTVVARFGDEGSQYASGTVFQFMNGAIGEATKRAEAFGLGDLINDRS